MHQESVHEVASVRFHWKKVLVLMCIVVVSAVRAQIPPPHIGCIEVEHVLAPDCLQRQVDNGLEDDLYAINEKNM